MLRSRSRAALPRLVQARFLLDEFQRLAGHLNMQLSGGAPYELLPVFLATQRMWNLEKSSISTTNEINNEHN